MKRKYSRKSEDNSSQRRKKSRSSTNSATDEKKYSKANSLVKSFAVNITGARPLDILVGAEKATRDGMMYLTKDSGSIPPRKKCVELIFEFPDLTSKYLTRLKSISFFAEMSNEEIKNWIDDNAIDKEFDFSELPELLRNKAKFSHRDKTTELLSNKAKVSHRDKTTELLHNKAKVSHRDKTTDLLSNESKVSHRDKTESNKKIKVEFHSLGNLQEKLDEDDCRTIMSQEMYIKDIQEFFPRKEDSKAKRHTLAFLSSRWKIKTDFEIVDNFDGLTLDLDGLLVKARKTTIESKDVPPLDKVDKHSGSAAASSRDLYVLSGIMKNETEKQQIGILCNKNDVSFKCTRDEIIHLVDEMIPLSSTSLEERKYIRHLFDKLDSSLTPAFWKSLIQKIIRFKPTVLTAAHPDTKSLDILSLHGGFPKSTDTKTLDVLRAFPKSSYWLLMSIAYLITNPGSFVPDIKRFVSGLESALKRFVIILFEDSSFTKEQIPRVFQIAVGSLLAQRIKHWRPSREFVKNLFELAISALNTNKCFTYSKTRAEKLSPYYLQPLATSEGKVEKDINKITKCMKVNLNDASCGASESRHASPLLRAISAIIDEDKSFQGDLLMIRDIVNLWITKSCPIKDGDEKLNVPREMDLFHCVDQHWFPDVGYFFPIEVHEKNCKVSTTKAGMLRSAYTNKKPFGKLFKKLFDQVTGYNPRRETKEIGALNPSFYEAAKIAQYKSIQYLLGLRADLQEHQTTFCKLRLTAPKVVEKEPNEKSSQFFINKFTEDQPILTEIEKKPLVKVDKILDKDEISKVFLNIPNLGVDHSKIQCTTPSFDISKVTTTPSLGIHNITTTPSLDIHNITTTPTIGIHNVTTASLGISEVTTTATITTTTNTLPRNSTTIDSSIVSTSTCKPNILRESKVIDTSTSTSTINTLCNASKSLHTTSLELHRSWLAGWLGDVNIKVGSKNLLVCLNSKDIEDFVVVARPSRTKQDVKSEIDDELKSEAIKKFKKQLTSKVGIKLKGSSAPIPEWTESRVRWSESLHSYKIKLLRHKAKACKTSEEPLNGMSSGGITPVWVAWDDARIIDISIDMNPINRLIDKTDVDVLNTVLGQIAGYKDEIIMPKFNRTGESDPFIVDIILMCKTFNFLCELSDAYPDTLQLCRNRSYSVCFKVLNGPRLWTLKGLLEKARKTPRKLLEKTLNEDKMSYGGVTPFYHVDPENHKPWQHQIDAVNEMMERLEDGNLNNFIWLDAGRGKTDIVLNFLKNINYLGKMTPYIIFTTPQSAIKSICTIMEQFQVYYTIIASPKTFEKSDIGKSKKSVKYFKKKAHDSLNAKDGDVLIPYTVNIIEHDYLRRHKYELLRNASKSILIIDECHKTMNEKVIRSGICLELMKQCRFFIAMTGTPVKDEKIYKLMSFFQFIVPYKVTRSNFFACASAMITKHVKLDIEIDRRELLVKELLEKARKTSEQLLHHEAKVNKTSDISEEYKTSDVLHLEMKVNRSFSDEKTDGKYEILLPGCAAASTRYYELVPPRFGGKNIRPSQSDFREALNICYDIVTRAIVDYALKELKTSDRGIMIVAKDNSHQKDIFNRLCGISGDHNYDRTMFLKNDDIFLIENGRSIHLTDEAVESKTVHDYKVVITTIKKCEGYSLTRFNLMLSSIYPSNQASRTQIEHRLARIGQRSKKVRFIYFTFGILENMAANHCKATTIETMLREMEHF